MNHYEIKQQMKKDRLLARAAKKRAEADRVAEAGREALSAIPFGQPILIGHHSEKADRNYRARAVGKIEKGYALENEADRLEDRADAVGNGGISSDDPDAIVKLEGELNVLRDRQANMKLINKAHAAYEKDPASLEKSNLSDAQKDVVRSFVKTYSWIKHPYAGYQFTNLSANIRRIEKRIESLKKLATAPEMTPAVGIGWTMHEDREENRIVVTFTDKPSRETCLMMRRRGFLWSPSRGAWVRKITGNAKYAAEMLVRELSTASCS